MDFHGEVLIVFRIVWSHMSAEQEHLCSYRTSGSVAWNILEQHTKAVFSVFPALWCTAFMLLPCLFFFFWGISCWLCRHLNQLNLRNYRACIKVARRTHLKMVMMGFKRGRKINCLLICKFQLGVVTRFMLILLGGICCDSKIRHCGSYGSMISA